MESAKIHASAHQNPLVLEVPITETLRGAWLGVHGTPEQAIELFRHKHGYVPLSWARNPLDGHVLVGPVQEVQR